MSDVDEGARGRLEDWLVNHLCPVSFDEGCNHVRVPVQYPNGERVGVYIRLIEGEYYVSDGGAGYVAACRAECGNVFLDYAHGAARQCGACWDMGNRAFVMSWLRQDQLLAAVSCVAGASFLAVQLAVMVKGMINAKLDEVEQRNKERELSDERDQGC